MSTLVEIAEYIEHVLRLDLNTPVRGYDGEELGSSNEQAQILANRTFWLKQRLESLYTDFQQLSDRSYVASINKQTGAVTIAYSDVGAAAEEHTHKPSDIKTSDDAGFVSVQEKSTWNGKQDRLISGETLKTILGLGLLGEGDITFTTSNVQPATGRQYVTESQIEQWTAKQSKLVSGKTISTLHGKDLLAEGDIQLTYKDVGADKDGAASSAITEHVATDDPHAQYLTRARAKDSFVDLSTANKPNGYLQLDSTGNIPAEMAELYKARYVIVDDKTERLKIPEGGDITISLQLDENAVYYLDGGKDPSVEDNWKKGRSSDVSNITSVFGRTGVVLPVAGDYNTDQITETDDKTFVSSDDRTNWNAKQEKLASGKNIRTINGNSVLGASDIEITPDSIGAADKEHTHTPDNIKTTSDKQFVSAADKENWDAKQTALVSGSNIKTINSTSVLGDGDIQITPKTIGAAESQHTHTASDVKTDSDNQFVSSSEKETWSGKQDALSSGKNIKTINSESLLGSGDIEITPETIGAAEKSHKHITSDITTDENGMFVTQTEKTLWTEKQDHLVSGKNISTIFGKSLLSGNDIDINDAENLAQAVADKLKAGNNIAIELDEESGLITISNTNTNVVKPTVVDLDNVIGGRGYRFRLNEITFNSDFKVFKYIPIFKKRSYIIDYTNPDVPLVRNTLPDDAGVGYYPNGKADISIVTSAVSNSIEKYISGEFTTSSYPTDTEAVIAVCENTLENITPSFTAANTVDGFTPFASSTYGNFYPWKAFQEQLKNEEKAPVADKNAWSANEVWNNRPSETYLGIKNNDMVPVTGYAFQNFTSLYWSSYSTPPTAWEFQGKNEDNDDWVTLDTQVDQNIMNGNDGWTSYRLNKTYRYKQYRVLITNVTITDNARAVIPRMALCNDVGMLVIDKQGRYLAPDAYGDFKVVNVTNANSFRIHCFNKPLNPLTTELLELIEPIKFCTLKNIPITVKQCKTVPAIGLQNPIYKQTFWDGLQDINPKIYISDNTDKEIKVAVTVDSTNYYVYRDDKWTFIGQYVNDDASAEALLNDGMSGEEFLDITNTQWGELLDMVDEPIIGMAFSRNVVSPTSFITPQTMEILFDDVYGWEVVSFDKAVIHFTKDFVIFNPVEDGRYRFSYKFEQ